MIRIAAFVSPHGFGHAARTSAVIKTMSARVPTRVHLFTTAPEWFFTESISGLFDYHREVVDVGFVQRSALTPDVPRTLEALRALVPFDEERVDRLAATVRSAGCDVVLCDIASLGIAVAERAGLPSLLFENFTWDWLYQPIHEGRGELAELGGMLDRWLDRATVHLQTQPLCDRDEACEVVAPISRSPTLDRKAARDVLGLDPERQVVVITMGGYGEPLAFLDDLRARSDVDFVVTGTPETGRDGNLCLFDNNTPLFMPNVLRAADAVVAKLGYGTVGEVWAEGLPFAYVTRPDFREMPPLEHFAEEELSGFLVRADEFREGRFVSRLDELLSMPRKPHAENGADRVAEVLIELAAGG